VGENTAKKTAVSS